MKDHKTIKNTLCACLALLYLVFAVVYVIYIPQRNTLATKSIALFKTKSAQTQLKTASASKQSLKNRFARPRVILEKRTVLNLGAVFFAGVLLFSFLLSYQTKTYSTRFGFAFGYKRHSLAVFCNWKI